MTTFLTLNPSTGIVEISGGLDVTGDVSVTGDLEVNGEPVLTSSGLTKQRVYTAPQVVGLDSGDEQLPYSDLLPQIFGATEDFARVASASTDRAGPYLHHTNRNRFFIGFKRQTVASGDRTIYEFELGDSDKNNIGGIRLIRSRNFASEFTTLFSGAGTSVTGYGSPLFSNDGVYLYLAGYGDLTGGSSPKYHIIKFTMSTPFDISTANSGEAVGSGVPFGGQGEHRDKLAYILSVGAGPIAWSRDGKQLVLKHVTGDAGFAPPFVTKSPLTTGFLIEADSIGMATSYGDPGIDGVTSPTLYIDSTTTTPAGNLYEFPGQGSWVHASLSFSTDAGNSTSLLHYVRDSAINIDTDGSGITNFSAFLNKTAFPATLIVDSGYNSTSQDAITSNNTIFRVLQNDSDYLASFFQRAGVSDRLRGFQKDPITAEFSTFDNENGGLITKFVWKDRLLVDI